MNVKERFLNYVVIDSGSSETSGTHPSTERQWDMARLLEKELKEMGAENVRVSPTCYVYAEIPANVHDQPAIGLIAHMDTAPAVPTGPVHPRCLMYAGGELDVGNGVVMKPEEFECLKRHVGHELIVTDGTTLLGGDDKAGIAEIMTLCELLMTNPDLKHGKICVGFTPDEEIGEGADDFDIKGFGAVAFDVTHSHTKLDKDTAYGKGSLDGNSFSVSYSKDFDQLNSRVTFAGYRFSEENFMTMSEYLDASDSEMVRTGNDKEMYTATYNQNFRDAGVSVYLNYTRHTYWDREEQTNYNIMLSHYFNMGSIRNMSVSLTGYRYEYDNRADKGMYISLSMPWGDNSTVSYNGNYGSGTDSSQVGYFSRVDDATHYQLNIGTSDKHTSVDGYYSHDGSLAQVDLSANYHEGQYTSAGLSLQGGATLTIHGGALHRTQNMGGTRLLIDADGVADVPVEGNGAAVYTNMFGKAVVSDVNNYYRNQAYIDLNKLPENAEATQSVVQATLTEGAIGYRKFAVISGQKAMAVLRLQDGSHPPFGAEVKNDNEQTVGLVDDDGSVYLAGVKPGEHMSVFWSGVAHCDINLPDPLPADLFNGLLLPCQHKGNVAPVVPDDIKPVIQEQTQQVTPTDPPVSVSANQ